MNSYFQAFAETLIDFSVAAKKNDRVLLDLQGIPDEMVLALVRRVRFHGAFPLVRIQHQFLTHETIGSSSEEELQLLGAQALREIQEMDCYVALRGSKNIFEMSDLDGNKQKAYSRALKPALDHRVNKTRWVISRWPGAAMAQLARKNTARFEDFFFRVCTLDYGRMEEGMAALKERMERTDRVRITAPGTDLTFSIRGIGASVCGGRHNIPDGEVYTAPVKNSVQGTISYNTPSVYHGHSFDSIRFHFEAGKIIQATANNNEALNEILDSDEGARYVGEFSCGFNPHILEPMCDILFDEKIAGSLHFTPGQAYDDCDNGNRSQVHWDLVLIQRPDYGGGEIYFDDELIRKDGLFVGGDLEKLNPDYLLGNG